MSPVLRATLIGSTTILMWSTLAILTTWSGPVPPFQLVGMAFAIVFVLALVKWLVRGESIGTHLKQPPAAWAVGVGGLFGYHFFYFVALKNAPPVEANLLNYLWPLLIVLFSALLPGERLRWWHVGGAAAGLAGTVLLISGDPGLGFSDGSGLGYLAAFGAALTWSSYSVVNRRFTQVTTNAVGGFCGLTAVLAFACHAAFETWVTPSGGQWLAVLGMGLGPVGLAFFTWDYGVKHGHIQVLGALAYAAPLLSTLLLIVFGQGEATLVVAAACGLIVGGAVLASKDLLFRKAD